MIVQITVITHGRSHHAVCSVHGSIAVWNDQALATFAAMGHAAHHHRRTE